MASVLAHRNGGEETVHVDMDDNEGYGGGVVVVPREGRRESHLGRQPAEDLEGLVLPITNEMKAAVGMKITDIHIFTLNHTAPVIFHQKIVRTQFSILCHYDSEICRCSQIKFPRCDNEGPQGLQEGILFCFVLFNSHV